MLFTSDIFQREPDIGSLLSIRLTTSPSLNDSSLNTIHGNVSISIGGNYGYNRLLFQDDVFTFTRGTTITGTTSGALGEIILDGEDFVKILNSVDFNVGEFATVTESGLITVTAVTTLSFSVGTEKDYDMFNLNRVFTITDNGFTTITATDEAEVFVADSKSKTIDLLEFLRTNTDIEIKEI